MSKSGYLVGDLIRIALHCAIRDRDGYAECDPGKYGKDARVVADDMAALLMRRYGEKPESR